MSSQTIRETTTMRLGPRNEDMEVVTCATVPPGTYVVGDPCYAVPDERWSEWLDASDMSPVNYAREHVLCADLDGHAVVGVGTAFGDGIYRDQHGNDYGVDAGMIGLVSVEVTDSASWSYAPGGWMTPVIMTFTEPTECYYDDGTIHLGELVIKTGDDDYDECWRCGGEITDPYSDMCDDCRDEDDPWDDDDPDPC